MFAAALSVGVELGDVEATLKGALLGLEDGPLKGPTDGLELGPLLGLLLGPLKRQQKNLY